MMQIYGCVFGTLGTTLTPNRWHFTMRLIPLYIGFFTGLIWDMRRVEERCIVLCLLFCKLHILQYIYG